MLVKSIKLLYCGRRTVISGGW